MYIEIGEDEEGEVCIKLEKRVNEAITRGLSKKGGARLRKFLLYKRFVFLVRLGKTSPASVAPMNIDLDKTKVPIRVRARIYSAPQRAFLNTYVAKLVEMGFLVANLDAEWQAALHIVSKPASRALF